MRERDTYIYMGERGIDTTKWEIKKEKRERERERDGEEEI